MIYLIQITIFTLISAVIDSEHFRLNQYIYSHTSRWLMRAFFIIVASNMDYAAMFGMALFFAATFDVTLNTLMGRDTFYLGTVAYWDKFWNKYRVIYPYFLLVCLICSIYILCFYEF